MARNEWFSSFSEKAMEKTYAEGPERSLQIAGAALAHIKKHGISANPNNFVVWYEYCAGANPKVKQALAPFLDGNATLSDQVCDEIYSLLYAEKAELDQAENWSARIETIVDRVSGALEHGNANAEGYDTALKSFSNSIKAAEDLAALAPAVGLMDSETQAMASVIQGLQAQVVAAKSEVAQLSQELDQARDEAVLDALTGIGNRKGFDSTLADAMANATQFGGPLSLILCDIDHFKAFNDKYGHPVGDQVLRVVGKTLHEQTKGQDYPARYGGEEFAVILPETPIEGARILAENIRKAIGSKKLRRRGSEEALEPITISLGVTILAPGETGAAFVDRADRALYSAKRAGRNRVIVDHPQQPAARVG